MKRKKTGLLSPVKPVKTNSYLTEKLEKLEKLDFKDLEKSLYAIFIHISTMKGLCNEFIRKKKELRKKKEPIGQGNQTTRISRTCSHVS